MRATEVIPWWRRRNAPLQRCTVPGIFRRRLSSEAAVNQVEEKNQLRATGDERGNRDEFMKRHKGGHKVVYEGSVRAHVADETQIMEGHEDAVGAHEGEPEMYGSEGFVHHAPSHFWKPKISAGED